MRKISFEKGKAAVKVENLDDLWYLSQIIEETDLVSGRTLRKISKESEEERSKKAQKKPVFLKILVEKVEFSESMSSLRVLGTVAEGSEDIPKGIHHSFNIELGSEISIQKELWPRYQKEKLDESFSSQVSQIIIVVFDREEAYIALMKKYGYEILAHLEGDVQKKDYASKSASNFYEEIIESVRAYSLRYSATAIILASPAFWKDELSKHLTDESLKKKIIFATCSGATKSAITEILKRPEVKEVLAQDRTAIETNLVESLFSEIATDGRFCYGFNETKKAAAHGAIATLLVTDSLIQKKRQDKSMELETLMKEADSAASNVHIVSARHEAGRKLDGLGGIAAILRYKKTF